MNNSISYGPLWAEINLDRLIHNANEIKKSIDKDTLITGVVKANAYGHGAIMVSKVLLENGFDRLAVATVREAIELRNSGIDCEILILGFTQISDLHLIMDYDLIQTIYNLEQAKALSNISKEYDFISKIHLKIDTGLSRLGFLCDDKSIEDIMKISNLENIEIEGIFTHLATADQIDKTFAHKQVNRYLNMIDKLEFLGLNFPIKHVSNSAVIIDLPEYNFDMIKAGIIQYGLYPSEHVNHSKIKVKPIMEVKTKISHIKKLKKGTGISYGQTYRLNRDSIVATIPVGYADGISRLVSNLGEVGVAGKRAKVIGNICMDQMMIDITDINGVKLEDEVVLIGNGDNNYPRIEELAENMGTINYEIATLVGRRIPRVYIKSNDIITVTDYLFG